MHQFLLYLGLGIVAAAILSRSAVVLSLEYAGEQVAKLAGQGNAVAGRWPDEP